MQGNNSMCSSTLQNPILDRTFYGASTMLKRPIPLLMVFNMIVVIAVSSAESGGPAHDCGGDRHRL
jgi:hypothetical protein